MKRFIQLFNKVGGWGVLKQYARAHVLLYALIQTLLCGFSKKGLEILRLAVGNKILCKLRRKYRKTIAQFQQTYSPQPRQRSNKVWVCWFQGMENAPPVVQKCYAALQTHLPDREIILITDENYSQYVTFPDYILEKAQKGIIPKAQFSDLLRLELLLHHGGTWIDSTVFCSGGNIPSYMLDSELFMFQTLKPGLDGHPTAVSNWFMTSCTSHPILELTRDLLYTYWKRNNSMVDYFIFHDFFQLATEAFPEEWNKVVPFSNATPHILLLRLFETYDPQIWEGIRNMTPFHKLTYKFSPEDAARDSTYYRELILPEQ